MQEEEILQTLCVNWYKSHTQPAAWPLLIHVPNERKCSRQRGALLRGMGVTAGVADLIFFRANNNHHGLCIELKTPTGRQRDSQKTWQEAVEGNGYKYVICRTLEEFAQTMQKYIANEI